MHATRMKSMLVFLTTTLALALALVVPPDVSVSYSQTAPTHYLPSVVVYWPSFTREIGGLPMMPTITTLVEPNSRTFPIHLKTLRLPVQVTLNANQHDTMFQSVTLHVLGTAGQTQTSRLNQGFTPSWPIRRHSIPCRDMGWKTSLLLIGAVTIAPESFEKYSVKKVAMLA